MDIKIFKVTLSKILCKCKQDSVISYFLYLDSVIKQKYIIRKTKCSGISEQNVPFLKRNVPLNSFFY